MGYCCRIFTPVQPPYPAGSLRDFLSGAYTARLSFIDLARFCCASFIVLARPRPPAPQSFDTRLPSTASRVPYCRNSLARGDSIRRHAAEQPIPQDQRVKQNSSKMGDEREE